jgi:hypothetical protein
VRHLNATVDASTDTARMPTHHAIAIAAFDPTGCPASNARIDSISGVHG